MTASQPAPSAPSIAAGAVPAAPVAGSDCLRMTAVSKSVDTEPAAVVYVIFSSPRVAMWGPLPPSAHFGTRGPKRG